MIRFFTRLLGRATLPAASSSPNDARAASAGIYGVLVSVTLSGCAGLMKGPVADLEPAPMPVPQTAKVTGSIYQPHIGSVALFEDRKPRMVGDILTVDINESIAAQKNASTNTNRNASLNAKFDTLGAALKTLGDYGFEIGGGNTFGGSGASEANNKIQGKITAQVFEIMPNGNLRIIGQKKMRLNKDSEYILFSGIVDPRDVSRDNTVSSSKIARAEIEYVGVGPASDANSMGWLQRLWLKIAPF